MYNDVELDISIRANKANADLKLETVAIDRSRDSDMGLSSVAVDPLGRAWAMPEYLNDRNNKTLTIYYNQNSLYNRPYADRMQTKFPDHTLIGQHDVEKPSALRLSKHT